MVYGKTLQVPDEYFAAEEPTGCPDMFLQKLRERMRRVGPKPTAHHIKQKAFVHKELDCTHVFVRVDRATRSLEQPYEGPSPIIKRLTDFLYRINYKDRPTEINIDRLKPAFIERTKENQQLPENNSLPEPSPVETEKGHLARKIRFATP